MSDVYGESDYAPNGSDNFSQGNEERHRDSRHEDRSHDDRDERHRDRHQDDRHDDRHGDRREDRRSVGSRSRSRSRNRSRSPRARSTREDDVNPGNNLFVTGLSMKTQDRDLEEAFMKYGKVVKAQIMYDPHTRESRGFGFVTMDAVDEAEAAREGISGTELDGRVVTVEKARRSRARTPTPGRYYGPPKRREPRRVDRFDPRHEYRHHDRHDRPPRGYGRDPYYDRGYDRSYYDRGYDRGYDRNYDRGYDRGYDRDSRRPPPPTRYEPYPPRPRSPY